MANTTLTRMSATTVFGEEFDLTPGVVDPAAIEVFNFGHCSGLALAVHERTGWQLHVGIEASNDWMGTSDLDEVRRAADRGEQIAVQMLQNLWAHVVVERPDGLFVDINGARDRDTVLASLDASNETDDLTYAADRHRLVPATAAVVASLTSIAPAAPRKTYEAFVDAVLELPDIPSEQWPYLTALRTYITDGLADAREAADEGHGPYEGIVGDLFAELDEEHHMLLEALNRGLIPDEVVEIARTIVSGDAAQAA